MEDTNLSMTYIWISHEKNNFRFAYNIGSEKACFVVSATKEK